MNRTSNHILEMQFKPLTRKADELITEVQNTAFEVGYNQGIDDLVTYLHKKGFDLLNAYFELHDMLSDMIEGGRLTEGDIPDDYAALVEQLEQCNAYYEEMMR